jgi:hypothetical protein
MNLTAPARRRTPSGVVGLLALAALVALSFLTLPAFAIAAGKVIEGTVTAPGAAEEVEVCVVEPLPSESCTYPEPDGHYLLNGLAPGASYLVEFLPSYRSHYVIQYYKGKPSPEGAQLVPVNSMSNTTGIDADLEIGGQIEGEASDAEGGGPLSGVEVCALDARASTEAESKIAACTRTDVAGQYRLPTLSPGTYKVGFWGAGESSDYLSAYYGGAPTFSAGTTIVVTAGTTTPGVDAALAISARIEGNVTEADGNPVGQIAVCALTSGSGAPQRCSYADATGHYALTGLASGSYAVVFAPGLGELGANPGSGEGGFLTQYYEAAPDLAQARPVSLVAPQAALGIDASLVRSSSSLPAPPAPIAAIVPANLSAPTVLASSPPPKCKKGFRRRRVKGHARCVKVTSPKRHRKSGTRRKHHRRHHAGVVG